ncbi:NLR family CARD domain-containing protein 3-like, partial [Cyprinus carpio]|uniref:NLR family CARD domain-containing protein 3-like n=1 Tax=Cyprinus carpio TaxID=7962 RepID=A0A9R0AMS8_CYPCA
MREKRGKMSLSQKQSVRSGSHVSSSVSVKSDRSKDGVPPNFSEKKTSSTKSVRSDSHVSSSVSVKSDWSKEGVTPNLSEKKTSSTKRVQYETLDSDVQTHRNYKNFKDNLLQIFQDLESKIITFLKNELQKFKKILQKEDLDYFVKDFNENRCTNKEAALDLTLCFLREMKQDEAADTLENELFFIHQLKCSLKKKYQCVFEGIAKQGDSTLLKNIYTDLYITQGCSEQVNTEHEVRQIEVASRRHESQEIQVECKNLFEAPEQDKQIRTVLTKGVAGIGKSVSVQKFVLDWAEGKENQDISFIFPLPFREMNLKEQEKLSLMDLITQFFPETKGLKLTRRNQFKVLFILDGLDECRLPVNFKDNETKKKKSIFVRESTKQKNKSKNMIDLLKTAVDKALESDNGHLDLFLRFLLGLSIQANQRLLQGLLTQKNRNQQSKEEIVRYIKQKFESNLSPERSINLFYCLNELNDQTLVKDIQTHLSKGSLSSADLSPA